jgi:hypothetical protein
MSHARPRHASARKPNLGHPHAAHRLRLGAAGAATNVLCGALRRHRAKRVLRARALRGSRLRTSKRGACPPRTSLCTSPGPSARARGHGEGGGVRVVVKRRGHTERDKAMTAASDYDILRYHWMGRSIGQGSVGRS